MDACTQESKGAIRRAYKIKKNKEAKKEQINQESKNDKIKLNVSSATAQCLFKLVTWIVQVNVQGACTVPYSLSANKSVLHRNLRETARMYRFHVIRHKQLSL